MIRPRQLVVVSGTSTEVGKTWVAARLLEALRGSGRSVAARKPAQSFAPGEDPTDAAVLGAASGEPEAEVCRHSFPLPMAPPMAAERLGMEPPLLAALLPRWPDEQVDVGVVEGAGGVCSPLAADGHTADLARMLDADAAVLVSDCGLGAINAVRLCHPALAPVRVVVYLNRFDPVSELHALNLEWLSSRDGLDVATSIDQLVGRLFYHLGK